jgi:hypothetical protein
MKRIRSEEYKQKQREYNKRKYQENPEKERERSRQWKKANPEKIREQVNRYRERHPIYYVLKRAKDRANKLGIEFNLTEEDITIPMICPYLKTPLKFELGQGYQDTNISLDRIDSTKGYIKGNIEVISTLANRMKSNATQEQLERFATEVLQRVGKC